MKHLNIFGKFIVNDFFQYLWGPWLDHDWSNIRDIVRPAHPSQLEVQTEEQRRYNEIRQKIYEKQELKRAQEEAERKKKEKEEEERRHAAIRVVWEQQQKKNKENERQKTFANISVVKTPPPLVCYVLLSNFNELI